MNIESIIAILANLVTIIVAAKNDTPLFSLFKKNLFLTQICPINFPINKIYTENQNNKKEV